MHQLGVAAVIAVLAVSAAILAQEQPRFRTGVDLVQVDVIAIDGKGRTVPDLRQPDFEVREDGKIMEIVTFVPAAIRPRADTSKRADSDTALPQLPGRFLVLLLDDVFTSPLRTTNIRKVAHQIVDRMEPGDELAVIALNGDNTTSTVNKAEAAAKIDEFTRGRPPMMGPGQIRALMDHTVQTIGALGTQLAAVPNRRKSIVCIGSAVLFRPTVPSDAPGQGSSYSQYWFEAVSALARANVSVYIIDPRGQPVSGPDITQMGPEGPSMFGRSPTATSKESSQSFTQLTGGDAFVETNLFDRAIDQVWREAGEYYLLGYYPPPRDGKLHSIDVSVKRRGVTLRHRKSRG